MKKPQCEKPTAYNCGQACINVSKSCQQSPSDSFGRNRLQKLKQVAAIFAKSKGVKNKKGQESTNRLIDNITAKRKVEAGELKQARGEINAERRKARLKAEAKAKREQLLKLSEEFEGKSKTKGATAEVIKGASPNAKLWDVYNSYKKQISKAAKSNPLGAKEMVIKANKKLEVIKEENANFLAQSRKLIEVSSPTKINASISSPSYREGVEAFSRMVSIPNLKDPINIVDAPPESQGRSFYNLGSNQVYMGVESSSTVIHEMSHWLEEKVPGIRREVVDFYNKRTKGEDLVRLRDVTGNKAYGEDEVTRTDKWLHPYMGKEYKDASEILSMGMEMMYENPAYLAKNDPEMFDFIYSVVRRG
ncbi:MAG: hypothetical protein ACKPEN_17425 [Planktothrix sp.]|uniref:hypothetical protein n=2 Tax=Planktothrix sp. TaxID=3088171 RepID=UPI0038D41258